VSTHYPETGLTNGLFAHSESDDGGILTAGEITAARLERPGILLLQSNEALLEQTGLDAADGMPRTRTGVDKFQQLPGLFVGFLRDGVHSVFSDSWLSFAELKLPGVT
jgi:hypothetical protein